MIANVFFAVWICAGAAMFLCGIIGVFYGIEAQRSYHTLSSVGYFLGSFILGVPGLFIALLGRQALTDARTKEQVKAESLRVKQKQDEIRREQSLRAQQEQHEAEQERLTCSVAKLMSAAHEAIVDLPRLIDQTEVALAQAEREFSDGAFAPFWDAVEKAITSLASYDGCIRTIARNSHRVVEDIRLLDKPPRVEFPPLTFPEAAPTLARMARIVRQAQKDFHFATIYEQRRTNGILIAGFANLGCALDDMGSRIQCSVTDLAQTLDTAITSMSQVHSVQLQEVVSGMSRVREQLASDSSTRRQHEGVVEEMLDNIQRRRKPSPTKIGDGRF